MKSPRQAFIQAQEAEIDRQINWVVVQFQNLDAKQLLKQGKEGGWSIAQNLHHLNLYFDYYLPAIATVLDKSKESPSAKIVESNWLGKYFTNAMDHKNGKKIKAFKDYVPPVDLKAHEVVAQFIQNEEELLRLVRKAVNYDLSKVKVAISLTKWIKIRLGDVFRFVLKHNERHLVQAESRLN